MSSCSTGDIPEFQRESTEFLAIEVKVDGEVVTEDVEVCITTETARPADDAWEPAVELSGKIGVMVTGLVSETFPATYKAWARVVTVSETVVLDCGPFRIL